MRHKTVWFYFQSKVICLWTTLRSGYSKKSQKDFSSLKSGQHQYQLVLHNLTWSKMPSLVQVGRNQQTVWIWHPPQLLFTYTELDVFVKGESSHAFPKILSLYFFQSNKPVCKQTSTRVTNDLLMLCEIPMQRNIKMFIVIHLDLFVTFFMWLALELSSSKIQSIKKNKYMYILYMYI